MVFNSLFGFKRSGTAHDVEETEGTAARGSARGRIDGRNVGPNREQLVEVEEEYQAKQKGSSLSESEMRILKAVSKSSINSTEDGKETPESRKNYYVKYRPAFRPSWSRGDQAADTVFGAQKSYTCCTAAYFNMS